MSGAGAVEHEEVAGLWLRKMLLPVLLLFACGLQQFNVKVQPETY
jgi:hypothetical protein